MGSKWRFGWRLTEWGWWFKKCGGRVLGFKVSLVIEEVWVVASRIWWFSSFELFGLVALGSDNFAGVWENEGFQIYDFVFERIFWVFCVYFSRKFLGSLVCLRGRTWSSCYGERRNEFSYGKKEKRKTKVKQKINLIILIFVLIVWLAFFINLNTELGFKKCQIIF